MNTSAERRLRIAFATAYPRENTITGGVESVAAALADGLARTSGIEVHVITCVVGLSQPTERRTDTGVIVHSVPSLGKLAWLIGYPVEAKWIRRKLREIAPDIVHCQAQTLYPYASMERGWPSVMSIHGLYFREVALMSGWRRFQGNMIKRFETDAIRRAKHIICTNRYLAEASGQLLENKDVRYLDNPISDRYFGVASHTEPERILFGGTIIHRKNVLGLLEAIKKLSSSRPNIKLRVAGTGSIDPNYYQRCVDYARNNGIEGNVDFLGGIPIDAMLEELSKATMLVLPAFQETAPLIISEAQAAGLPVVATPAGGTADMVENGKAGLIVPFDDANALADSIDAIISDEALRSRMSQYARQLAEKRYRLSSVVAQVVEYYRDILAERN